MVSLDEQLAKIRQDRFVGREAELTLFLTAITASPPPFNLLFIYGPSGVGKTALLQRFIALCCQRQTPAFYISGHLVEPTPEAFKAALRASGLSPGESLPNRFGLFIDNYEHLSPLDSWLRDRLLPTFPRQSVTVIAGTRRPPSAWLTDPGWQAVTRVLPLRNLSRSEARRYLERLGVPSEQHEAVLDFTHGHPLALTLVAELFKYNPALKFRAEAAPDIIWALLERFVAEVPSALHREVLAAAALVRVLTEPLLATMLDLSGEQARALFEWLRSCSFIEAGPYGLYPHDLVREVVATDLKWRNPDRYGELLGRARTFYAARLRQAKGDALERLLNALHVPAPEQPGRPALLRRRGKLRLLRRYSAAARSAGAHRNGLPA